MISVVSVNVGKRSPLRIGKRDTETGIFKASVAAPVEVKLLGVTGDAVCDRRHHGGPDQAVYLYRQEDYEWWSEQLGRVLDPGTFGDNLTVKGIPGPGLQVGDRLDFPGITLEITAPRIPCSTLATRMGDPGFVKAFLEAQRPGFYCRVIRPGLVQAGEAGELVPSVLDSISTLEFYEDLQGNPSPSRLKAYLSLPIDERSRAKFEAQLQRIEAD